ncbi:hypothetical protein POJ06DRAFT_268870 [Lipomyces tetrasporus]|uniref:Uncharacterized protein n=1 Tax=Lipomyces tetrasporus TaxID=54092 RepID=A0AAD7QRP9_9ASCO|nr:uncharacterized protein POJ06DRAFT_268870 [Lipomyces tetrasporus]KAJ8099991.1 hypothetical protein POJ06DRAFT_268870 [Lipomyces tetrasporus]
MDDESDIVGGDGPDFPPQSPDVLKKPKAPGTLHKRPAQAAQYLNQAVFHVTAKSPFISLLKRAKKEVIKLHSRRRNVVLLVGLSKAIEKTLSLGLRFQHMGYAIQVETDTVVINDDLEPDDLQEEWRQITRSVSRVKITVSLKSGKDKKERKKVLVDSD